MCVLCANFLAFFCDLNVNTMPDHLGTDQRKPPQNENDEKQFQCELSYLVRYEFDKYSRFS